MGNYVSNSNSKKLMKEKAAQEEAILRQLEADSLKELLMSGLIMIATLAAVSLGVILVIGF